MAPFVYPGQVMNAQNAGEQAIGMQGPVLSFVDSSISVNEKSSRVSLKVKLVKAGQSAVSVEVAFLSRSSTASSRDIGGFSTQTVSFTPEDSSGTIRSIAIYLPNDGGYEGRETAVFRLQNNTSGHIVSPDVFTVTLLDNDVPNIVVNEIFADSREPNKNAREVQGKYVSEVDFIELVNNESVEVDISGWMLSGQQEMNYQFPAGTVIEAGRALVIFDGEQPGGNFGGARLLIAESLDLPEKGDTIVLKDLQKNTVVEVSYGTEAGDGQSISRSPDLQGAFAKHESVQGSAAKRFSPGTKSDGSSFGSRFATGIRGDEGWRLISSPSQGTSFEDLFDHLWTQGSTGSSAPAEEPTIYTWTEEGGGSFSPITDMSRNLEAGKGYIIYFFEDDEQQTPGVQGGFPKFVRTDEPENTGTVTIPVTTTDYNENTVIDGMEGWNLLGNPYSTEISVDAVLAALESVDAAVNANLMTWDPSAGSGNGTFVSLASGDTIAPFQAFWVRYTNASGVEGSVSFSKRDLIRNNEQSFFSQRGEKSYGLTLSLSDGTLYDEYRMEFKEDGSPALTRLDGYKLHSLKPNAINLYGTSGTNKLSKNVLPVELDATLELPVAFEAPGRNTLELSWEGADRLPDSWSIRLIDRTLNKEVDLRSARNYRFTLQGTDVRSKSELNTSKLQLSETKVNEAEPRFLLALNMGAPPESESAEIPESVKLNPNYPNPFNPTTTISYELKEDAEVLLSIWNIVGQKVVTLVDGMKEAGEHTATWNASDMPSGLYIAQLEVGGEVFIRKMTLIK